MKLYTGDSNHRENDIYRRGEDCPFYTLSLLMHGSVELNNLNICNKFNKNDLLLTFPNSSYTLNFLDDSKELYVIFQASDNLVNYMNWPSLSRGISKLTLGDLSISNEFSKLINEIHTYNLSSLPLKEKFCINSLEKLFLMASIVNSDEECVSIDSRIRAIISYISENYHKVLNIEDLSKKVHLSPSRFIHLFYENMKISPMKYVEFKRIEKAKELLVATENPIQVISSIVGYNCPYHFSLRFKKVTKKSPKSFRQLHKR